MSERSTPSLVDRPAGCQTRKDHEPRAGVCRAAGSGAASLGCSTRGWATRCRSSRCSAPSPPPCGSAATVPPIVVGILGYFACDYLFIEPRGRVRLADLGDVIGLLAYLFTCSLIIAFGEATRLAQMRGQRAARTAAGHAAQHRRRGHHDRRRRPRHVHERRRRVADRLDAAGRASASRSTPCFGSSTRTRAQPVENPATKALREGVVVGLANHTVLIRKDGGECPIDDSAAPIRDERGDVSGCVLIFRDVTAQRRVERDKASQLLTARLLASIVESSDDAIISKSLDGVIQSWNAGAERLFGYTAEQAVGRHISLVIPPERIAEEDQIIASLKAGQRIEHFETERLRSDGRPPPRVAHHLADQGRRGRRHRRVEDRARRDRPAAGRAARTPAAGGSGRGQRQVPGFFDQGACLRDHGRGRHLLEANRLSWEALRLHPGADRR